ncbi:hypothetical protein GH714_009253 [Hevea brasiliensis]|uniref:Uncharacterized protein n=1 Tax=Hevea brasiliensis TaxID=3981 RepID=A0A6A6L250_HEVBR|nr:hypothetical protein GH714_009253 [Hevea brasiliensis]
MVGSGSGQSLQEEGRAQQEGQSDAGDEVIEEQRSLISNTQMGETQETEELSSEEGMDIDTGSLDVDFKRISELCFLKRVLREELRDDISDNKLLFIAIHAVFLESGFVGFNSVSGLRVDLFHPLEEQSSMSFTTSVSYTLPELLLDDTVTESVILRFQTLGILSMSMGHWQESVPV